MAKLVSFLSSMHNIQMPKVQWSIVLLWILLTTLAHSHTIHKRQNVFESEASNDKASSSVSNEAVAAVSSENETPFDADDGGGIDDVNEDVQSQTKNAEIQNVNEVNNVNVNNNNDIDRMKVSSTTDINNVIEQSFGARSNDTNARNTIVTIGTPAGASSGSSSTAGAPTNFTKDFSPNESIENRLPSKSSDRSASRSASKVTTVSLKEATAVTSPEKPKRHDATTFARSTERGIAAGVVADSDASANPVSHSLLSTQPVTARIATETIRARISSISPDVAEKRAKYLMESNTGSSSASPQSRTSTHNQTPDIAWSNLKTVGEVHHNNVTLGKSTSPSSEEHTIGPVNGKLDDEEISERDSSAERPSIATTQRNAAIVATAAAADEHETQLQKSNSSQIADLQDDNSLSSLGSSHHRIELTSSHRPIDVFVTTTKTERLRPATMNQEISQNVSKTTANAAQQPQLTTSEERRMTHALPPMLSSSTTEHSRAEETTIKSSERDAYLTTTEENELTTIVDETTTAIVIDETTTFSQHDSTLSKTPEITTINDLMVTDGVTTTLSPTTESKFASTIIPDDENRIQSELTTHGAIARETTKVTHSNGTSSASSTQPNVTETHTPKPINNKERIVVISKDDAQPEISSTTMIPTVSPTEKIPTSAEMSERLPEAMETPSTATTPQKMHESSTPTTVSIIGRKVPDHSNTPAPADHTEIAQLPDGEPADVNAMIAIGISIIAVITLILLVGFLYVMRKRQKQLTYSQRCRPIGLDAYSLDNISIYNSVRRKSAHRSSKRAFGNVGFDDPGLKNNPLTIPQLATFAHKRVAINEEFRDIPTVTARIEEVPAGCEDKNRYANVVPLPESRVHLKQLDGDEKTEYINANFVKGPKDTTHYYIACQAPLEHTIVDFWRMIWEQNSRVIIMATDLTENGIEKCAEYLPSSFVIDNHVSFGDYQITLKMREVREKYAVSMVHLKNSCTKTWREITHFWYQWPENGIPNDEASVIAMLLEARSYLKVAAMDQSGENGETQESDSDEKLSNGNLDKNKSMQRVQGPLTVHCSPGTGRTGTIIACDIAIRSLELPTRSVDIPQIVYFVRRGRASAVQTREQYEFIYKLAHVYATKLTGTSNDN